MTSKEAMNELEWKVFVTHKSGKVMRDEEFVKGVRKVFPNNEIDELFEQFDKLEKDLEVLEILKRNIYSSDESISVILDDLRNFDDFKKVKEWLNNDK